MRTKYQLYRDRKFVSRTQTTPRQTNVSATFYYFPLLLLSISILVERVGGWSESLSEKNPKSNHPKHINIRRNIFIFNETQGAFYVNCRSHLSQSSSSSSRIIVCGVLMVTVSRSTFRYSLLPHPHNRLSVGLCDGEKLIRRKKHLRMCTHIVEETNWLSEAPSIPTHLANAGRLIEVLLVSFSLLLHAQPLRQ